MSVEDAQTTLAGLEGKLSDANARRDNVIIEISRASEKAARDQNAKISLRPLNEKAKVIDGEIALLRIDIRHARRALELQESSAAAAREKAPIPVTDGPERLFLVKTPNNGQIRHRAQSVEQLRARLTPGYTIHGEIFGANDDGAGGVVAAIEPTGPSIMAGLLAAHGAELVAYLAERGIGGPVVVLPENGREI